MAGISKVLSKQKIDVHQHMLPAVYTDALAELGIHGAGGVAFPK